VLRAPSGERERQRKREGAHTQCFGVPIVRRRRRRLNTASRVASRTSRSVRVDPRRRPPRLVFPRILIGWRSPRRRATHTLTGESSKVDASDRGRCQEPTRRRSRYDGRLLVARWYYARPSYISRCRRRPFVSLRRARPRSARHPHRKLTLESFVSLHRAAKGVTRGFHRPNSINRQ
jgi:hypothetical protein